MNTFTLDIFNRKIELKKGDLGKLRTEIFNLFKLSLPEDYRQEHKHLSDFSLAFLVLYKEKLSVLRESYILKLQDNLTECYQHTEIEHLKLLTVEDDLSIHSIDFPKSENQVEWELSYEMDLDDTIFHVYFEGWRFKSIGRTN